MEILEKLKEIGGTKHRARKKKHLDPFAIATCASRPHATHDAAAVVVTSGNLRTIGLA